MLSSAGAKVVPARPLSAEGRLPIPDSPRSAASLQPLRSDSASASTACTALSSCWGRSGLQHTTKHDHTKHTPKTQPPKTHTLTVATGSVVWHETIGGTVHHRRAIHLRLKHYKEPNLRECKIPQIKLTFLKQSQLDRVVNIMQPCNKDSFYITRANQNISDFRCIFSM